MSERCFLHEASMPAVLKAPASMDRQPRIGQPLHQFPGRWTFLDRGDQNGSAACIGNLEAHATINRSFAGQFMCAPDDLHEQSSRVREFNSIGIFHNAKVIADVKIVDAHPALPYRHARTTRASA